MKKKSINYLIVFLLILISGQGNAILRDVKYSLVLIIFFFIAFYSSRMKITKNDLRVFIIFILYIVAYLLKYFGEFDPVFTFRVFSYIVLAYFTLKLIGVSFFKIYEDIIYYLALISFPFYLIQIIDFNYLYNILIKIQSILQIPVTIGIKQANIIIFTLNRNIPRNCGFAWEPGAFSEFLILALIVYLARNNFNMKSIRFWVLMLALISTFSTTGYLAFIVIFIWIIFNRKFNEKIILVPLFLIISIYILTLPFITTKIVELARNPQYYLEKNISSHIYGQSQSLGRFQGFIMNIKDFLNHPLIGFGGHGELTLSGRLNINVFSTNGLGIWLSRYGSIGFILLIYLYMKSFNLMSNIYNFKKPIILLVVLFVIGFGFGLLESSLFFTFMLSGFLLYPTVNKNIFNE